MNLMEMIVALILLSALGSVLIPLYNTASHQQQRLESLRQQLIEQRFGQIELSEGGYTDETCF